MAQLGWVERDTLVPVMKNGLSCGKHHTDSSDFEFPCGEEESDQVSPNQVCLSADLGNHGANDILQFCYSFVSMWVMNLNLELKETARSLGPRYYFIRVNWSFGGAVPWRRWTDKLPPREPGEISPFSDSSAEPNRRIFCLRLYPSCLSGFLSSLAYPRILN